jgi:hypothetical protein
MRSGQDEREKSFISEKLRGFVPTESLAWAGLTELFGKDISQEQLQSLAQIMSGLTHFDLSREFKRRKQMLIKWFDENWDVIGPLIQERISVVSDKGEELNRRRRN